MAVTEFVPVDPTLVATIRRHMQGLRRTPDGAALQALIEKGLKKYGGGQGHINEACVTYLHSMLLAYAGDTNNSPPSRVKARIIQQHLILYLPHGQATLGTNPFQPYIDAINSIGSPSAPLPPLAAVAYSRVSETTLKQETATPMDHDPPQHPIASTTAHPQIGAIADTAPRVLSASPAAHRPKLEQALGSDAPPEDLDANRYQALRKSELEAWRAIYGTIKDFKNLKQLWVSSLDDLLQQREALAAKLDSAADHVKTLESDRDELKAELGRARQRANSAPPRLAAPSKTGAKTVRKLTALPKRDTFMRVLEAEIERSKRSAVPSGLALALIDVPGVDDVVQQYNRKVGDAVLQCYAGGIFSAFRTYDVVARYDTHRFAVLFPATEKDGALRALEKAQKRASESHLSHAGKTLPLPHFISALTMYAAGDEPATLLGRVTQALESTRESGESGRVVVCAAD